MGIENRPYNDVPSYETMKNFNFADLSSLNRLSPDFLQKTPCGVKQKTTWKTAVAKRTFHQLDFPEKKTSNPAIVALQKWDSNSYVFQVERFRGELGGSS